MGAYGRALLTTLQTLDGSARSTQGACPEATALRNASPPPAAAITAASSCASRAAITSGSPQTSVDVGACSTLGTGRVATEGGASEREAADASAAPASAAVDTA